MTLTHNVGGKMEAKEIQNVLNELRKNKERKFDQSIDLIVNLKKFNIKKDSINIFIPLPNKIKEKRICAFFESKNDKIHTITRADFIKYKDQKDIKKLSDQFEFFIAQASLMPQVAATFGRVLGPLGKMPSPQMGVLMQVDEKSIKDLLEKINKSVRAKTKEPSIKLSIAKEKMTDKEIIENILTAYNAIEKALPREKDNIKNVQIKFTMSKPLKIQ